MEIIIIVLLISVLVDSFFFWRRISKIDKRLDEIEEDMKRTWKI